MDETREGIAEYLTRLARQVIEHAPLLGIGDLLVDPRRERRPPRLPLSHLPMIANAPLRRFLLLSND